MGNVVLSAKSRNILFVCGFTFLWYALRLMNSIIFASTAPSFCSQLAWLVIQYSIYSVFLVAGCALFCRLRKRPSFPTLWKALVTTVSILASVLLVALSLSPHSALLTFCTVITLGIFCAFHLCGWGAQIAAKNPSLLPLLLSCSFALSEFLRFFASPFPELLDCLCPVASLVFLLILGFPARQSQVSEIASLKRLPWGILVACTFLICLWLVLMGLLGSSQESALSIWREQIVYLITALALSVLCLYYLVAWKRHKGLTKARLFLYPLVAIAIGNMAVVGYVIVVQFQQFILFKQIFIALVYCLDALMFLLISYSVAQRRLSYALPMTVYAVVLSSCPWAILSRYIQSTAASMDSTTTMLIAVGLSFITSIFLIVLLLRAANTKDSSETGEGDVAKTLESLGEVSGLTTREVEVMSLLYRGYSSKRIAETLCVSDNTIRTHTTAIYRKLSIHSKQELIALVEAYTKR